MSHKDYNITELSLANVPIGHSFANVPGLSIASNDLEIAEGGSVKDLIVEGPKQGEGDHSPGGGDPHLPHRSLPQCGKWLESDHSPGGGDPVVCQACQITSADHSPGGGDPHLVLSRDRTDTFSNLEKVVGGDAHFTLPWKAWKEVLGGGGASSCSLDTWDQVGRISCLSAPLKDSSNYKDRLVESLAASGRGFEADQVAACGEDFKVGKCLNCGAEPAFPITCDHRLCPSCAAKRAAILVSEHEDMLKRLRYPKMLTLTFLSVPELTKEYIRWARKCFTKLRHRKVMAGCWGGLYSFESTYSVEYGWHLHIHALLGSGYIDQKELSKEWESITGARVVHICSVQKWAEKKAEMLGLSGEEAARFVKAARWNGIKEVVKYPAKAATFLDDSNLVNEFLVATRGVNLAYGFGALYRVKTKRHGEGKIICPVCGGDNIKFDGGYGFCVPKIVVERVKGGYLWRPPPGPPGNDYDVKF